MFKAGIIVMMLFTTDKNGSYTMHIDYCEWSNDREKAISFELNNTVQNDKDLIPDETTFIMSFEDAKELHAWLGCVLSK